MVKITSIGVLVLAVAVLVVESGPRWFTSRKQKKLDRCLNYCKSNFDVRHKLIMNICPDYCENIDCSNHGTCYMGRCTCDDGFIGCDCEIKDSCFNVHCENGGTCEEGECVCTENFKGLLCETDLCDCVNCNHHGTCVAGTCQCEEGFIGDFCETVDLCANVTCGKNGTCDNDNGKCQCDTGFFGDMCQNTRSCGERTTLVAYINNVEFDRFGVPSLDACETACLQNLECLTYSVGNSSGGFDCYLYDRRFGTFLLTDLGFNSDQAATAECN